MHQPIEQPIEGRAEPSELVVRIGSLQALADRAFSDRRGLRRHRLQRTQRLASDQPASDGGDAQRDEDAEAERPAQIRGRCLEFTERRHDDGDVGVLAVLDALRQHAHRRRR